MSELTEHELGAVGEELIAAGEPVKGPLSARRLAAGRSNLTLALTDDVSTWVLRTPPRVGRTPSAHDVGREYRVTAALAPAGFPVPRPVLFHAGEELLGAPFAVAEFVSGATVQTREQLDALDAETVAALVRELVATLAALHGVHHEAVGLGGFGRPDGYAQRQLKRWTQQWHLVGGAELTPLADEVIRRLLTVLPRQRATAVVHGDYRIDNTILDLADGARPRVAAVVDWELSTIGDPVADVAMMCAYRAAAFDLVIGSPTAWASERLPDEAALAASYEAAGGVRLTDWEAHLALAYFKIATIAAGIDYRHRLGAVPSPGSAEELGCATAGESVEDFLLLARSGLRRR